MRADVGRAVRAKPGERECGDRVVVLDDEPTRVLVAVIDGLGHGPRAAQAATAAERFITAHSSLELAELFRRCDRAISDTRGVAMTVLKLDRERERLHHAAVGNVELCSLSEQRVRPVPKPGIVGGRVPRVHESSFDVVAGDLFVLFSDGISSRIELEPYRGLTAQHMAEVIVCEHGKEHDDASCAVLRC